MKIVVGIDIGGSTTKLAGLTEEGCLVGTLQVRASDPVTSAYGGLGHFLKKQEIDISQVKDIVLTGVGASFLPDDMMGVPTTRVEEFQAIGRGGLALAGKKEALVVSMGTGTAYVRAGGGYEVHIGGSGVGGGTIEGLCSRLSGVRQFSSIMEMAAQGDLSRVNLMVSDITNSEIETLPNNLTASNFGNWKDNATKSDSALGVLGMVFETIGMLAVFACRNDNVEDVVLTGTLTTIPAAKEVFDQLTAIHPVTFTTPSNAIFATAIGAVLTQMDKSQIKDFVINNS